MPRSLPLTTRRLIPRGALALLLGITLGAPACTPPTIDAPAVVLNEYARAIQDGRVEDAYRLLSVEAHRQMSLEAFGRLVRENPDDARAMARALARPASEPLVTAKAKTPEGDDISLVFEKGRWRIDGSTLDLYSQATPKQAIEGFLRAFDRHRYDVLLRYVPSRKRRAEPGLPALDEARLRESFEGPQRDDFVRITQALRAALPTSTIEESNDHASMAYGTNGTLQLLREDGLWKIDAFQ